MNTAHYPHWPAGLPYQLTAPQTSLYVNLAVSALRYPEKTALIFFDWQISYGQLKEKVDALAGYLQQVCGVKRGDRVLLHMQNSPQFVIAFYAILRADAMVVPVNPMLMTQELQHTLEDSGAQVAITAQELMPRLQPLLSETGLRHVVMATYADCLDNITEDMPGWVSAARQLVSEARIHAWHQAMDAGLEPMPHEAGPADLACMPYTSGTTGKPKGCVHTHRSLMFTTVTGAMWSGSAAADHVTLAVLPLFHVTGMQVSMNAAIYSGATLVIMPRWDRDVAGRLITQHRITAWTSIPTMMIDFLSNPKLGQYDIGSLKRVSGGGAAMPAAVAQKLLELTGLQYMEGYGLSETIATTHSNPVQKLKQQCLGIPVFGVDSRVIDPETGAVLSANQTGEIIMHGPQVFEGYWQDEEKTRSAFIDIEGKQFFRSGDLGYIDEEGFFFFTDRLKRMINASGYKVWPAEVESMMYRHPEIRECCIIAAHDAYRGETVKAVIVKKDGSNISAEAIMQWAHENMAAYKVPKLVEFTESLPKSATGKVMWRALQEAEMEKK
jgi:fatty-acyl-CoA synthase